MTYDRRDVLAGIGALAALPLTPAVASQPGAEAAFLSCYRNRSGKFGIATLSAEGDVIDRIALPGRGHGIAVAPNASSAVVFARRPGRFALSVALPDLRRIAAFDPPADRHFYGHGAFSPEGRFLYATENDFDGERGVVGVYDVANAYHRVGEFDTGGIGPHQIILLSDRKTLAIANGGIATHPEFPRLKLNIPGMRPSLAYMDIETGRILEIATLPKELHQLSLRHLTETVDGTVWAGGQFEGDRSRRPPLIASHRRGEPLRALTDPSLYDGTRNYIGSIAVTGDGERVVATAPRGGCAIELDTRSRTLLNRFTMPDVCGVAAAPSGFLLTSGLGKVSLQGRRSTSDEMLSWDNHAVAATERWGK